MLEPGGGWQIQRVEPGEGAFPHKPSETRDSAPESRTNTPKGLTRDRRRERIQAARGRIFCLCKPKRGEDETVSPCLGVVSNQLFGATVARCGERVGSARVFLLSHHAVNAGRMADTSRKIAAQPVGVSR